MNALLKLDTYLKDYTEANDYSRSDSFASYNPYDDMQGTKEAYEILESDKFNSLLDAITIMAKAEGDILDLQRSIDELKYMLDETANGNEVEYLSSADNHAIAEIVNEVDELVADLADEIRVTNII